MNEGDLVRVRFGGPGFTDGLPGVAFVDGLSTPVMRHQGMRLVASLGGGATVVELDAEGNPLDALSADLAALPSEPASSDAPGVLVAHPAPPAPSASRDTLPGPGPRRPRS